MDEILLSDILSGGFDKYIIIDVRSESEFIEDHIPFSINIPILNDEERAKVGTVYKEQGSREAKYLAMDLLSPKLPAFIRAIAEAAADRSKSTVITCWRGGMRSGAAVTLSMLAGIRCLRLKNGYAEFRRHVHAFFNELSPDIRYITLFGPTGCAKSEVLRHLQSEGYPVIDLEKHACHKGSSFGDIGESGFAFVTQKSFETGVWLDFYHGNGKDIFFIEGESPKIGKVTIPKKLSDDMRKSIKVLANAPMDFRIDFTCRSYEPTKYMQDIIVSLENIERYIGKVKVAELKELLNKGHYEEFTRFMLESYYDPMYKNAFPKSIDYTIEYESIIEGVLKCIDIFKKSVDSY